MIRSPQEAAAEETVKVSPREQWRGAVKRVMVANQFQREGNMTRKHVRLQDTLKGVASHPLRKTLERNAKNLVAAEREILETEKTYVRKLGVLCETLIGPIRIMNQSMGAELADDPRGLLPKHELDAIFSNVEQLYTFHCDLLEQLKEAEADVNQTVGHVFIRNAGYLKHYKQYFSA